MRAFIDADKPLSSAAFDRIADDLLDGTGDRLERLAQRIAGRSELLILLVAAVLR